MNKKTYITPNISIVEMSCTTIIAASGGNGLTEGSGGSVEGNLGGGGTNKGDSWTGSHSASRLYFDSWNEVEDY